jgi:DNA helicase-2/ATP-dependent DNA helicase PcrA
VVGDPSQTIYSFAGATPEYLLGFIGRYPEATLVRLVRDYRSTPQVVGLANDLPVRRRRGGPAAKPSSPRSAIRSAAELVEYADEPAEAAGVADSIAALIAAGSARSDRRPVCTNAQSQS